MSSRARHSAETGSGDEVKEAAVEALRLVLNPLVELMFDAGLTIQEFNSIARQQAVQVATQRVIAATGRPSQSRVAIITGLPRSEVAKISKSIASPVRALSQHPARRVLAAWHENSQFLTPRGEPADLPIFGKRRSFEQLVEKNGGGIPVRAMLDELTELDAIERLEAQRVRAKTRIPIMTGLTSRSVAAVGARARDLLDTLSHNLRRSSQPLFEATAQIDNGDPEKLNFVRREITEQGMSFINGANSLLNRAQNVIRSKTTTPDTCRVGVTVYYFQNRTDEKDRTPTKASRNPRKNLRRRNT